MPKKLEKQPPLKLKSAFEEWAGTSILRGFASAAAMAARLVFSGGRFRPIDIFVRRNHADLTCYKAKSVQTSA